MTRRLLAGSFAFVGVLALTACTIPPVTTHEDPDGTVRTLEWADYPGHAYVDSADILTTPDIDEIEAHSRALMESIQDAVSAEIGIELEFAGDESFWSDFQTNGYGSPSLLTSYSYSSLLADEVPDDYRDWMRVYAIVARVSDEFGAGEMQREQDQDWVRNDPEQRAQFEESWTTGVPGEYSLLAAWTTGSGQSVMLTIDDASRRLAASAAEKKNEPRLSVDYSATVIERGKRAEFEERLAPFEGAQKPDSTEWD